MGDDRISSLLNVIVVPRFMPVIPILVKLDTRHQLFIDDVLVH